MESSSHPRAQTNQGNADQTVSFYPSNALSDHPLLAHIPVWERRSHEFISLLESIRSHGLDYPILIDSEQRVVDGRNRRNAMAVLNQPVPCRVINDADAASIIVASLVNRRHFSKFALAYFAYPMFAEALAGSKERTHSMLRSGGRSVTYSVGNAPKTIAEVAAQLGLSKALLENAISLHRDLNEQEEQFPDLRGRIEGIIVGDCSGYQAAKMAMSNIVDAEKRSANLDEKRRNHPVFFERFLPKLDQHWREASAEQREVISDKLRTQMLTWPADLLEEAAAAAKAAIKAAQQGGAS